MNLDKFRDNLIKDFRSNSGDNLNIAIREWQEQEESDRKPTDQELYSFLENYDGAEPDLIWWSGNITGKESMYTQYEQLIQNQDKKLRHFIYAGVLHHGSSTYHFWGSITNHNSFPSFDFIRNDMIKRAGFPDTSGMTLSFIQEVSIEDAVDYMS